MFLNSLHQGQSATMVIRSKENLRIVLVVRESSSEILFLDSLDRQTRNKLETKKISNQQQFMFFSFD